MLHTRWSAEAYSSARPFIAPPALACIVLNTIEEFEYKGTVHKTGNG